MCRTSQPCFLNPAAATSAAARRALDAIVEVADMGIRWQGLAGPEDQVRRAALTLYARLGRAPTAREISAESALAVGDVDDMLAALAARDIVCLDKASGAILGAYPFSEDKTGHGVSLDGNCLNAMCAVDALGAGAMFGRDTTVDSTCRGCGAPVHVATRGAGRALAAVTPAEAIVWAGLAYDGGCAATSLCRALAFFCCDCHLDSWRSANPYTAGTRLSMDEGLQLGRALFERRLEPADAVP